MFLALFLCCGFCVAVFVLRFLCLCFKICDCFKFFSCVSSLVLAFTLYVCVSCFVKVF